MTNKTLKILNKSYGSNCFIFEKGESFRKIVVLRYKKVMINSINHIFVD